MNTKDIEEKYSNKFAEKDIIRFTSQKLAGEEYTYRHSDDCKQSGCPTHKARIKYHSVTDMVSVDFGDGTEFCLDGTQVDILWDWLNRASLTQHHEAEVERRVQAERERILNELRRNRFRDNMMDDECESWNVDWQDALQALTPTKTDKQTEV